MIYNRTIQDVEQAKQIRAEKVQNFVELTEDEKAILERGFVGIATLNRIEIQQAILKNTLKSMGYYNCEFAMKIWLYDYLFKNSDLKRIFENARILKNAFFVYDTTPKSLEAKYHFEQFNNLEKTIEDIQQMTVEVKNRYRYCGTFNCGG